MGGDDAGGADIVANRDDFFRIPNDISIRSE
jgi:hypothetical protein